MRLIQSLSELIFTASVFILITQSALAETDGVNSANVRDKRKSISTIPQANAALLLTQKPGAESIVEVTGVRINQTEKGVEVILETNKGDALQPVQKNEGNKLIIDIPNAYFDSDKSRLNQLQESPLWQKLRAVQKNHVYVVDADVWRGGNLIAANLVLDDLYKYLINTHENTQ